MAAPPIGIDQPSKVHEYELSILEHHLDSFGHVNNATYLEILEEARWDWITAGGYGLERVKRQQEGPVVLDVHLRFARELVLREKITIRSRTLSYKSRIAKMEQKIVNEKGEDAATAIFTFGLFNLKTRRLVNPTPEWLKAIGL